MQRWYCVFVVLMKMDATVYNTVTLCNGRIVTLAWDIQRTKTVDDIPSLEDWCSLMKPTWEAIMLLNELAAHIRSSTRVKSTSFMSMETGLCTHTRARLGSIRRAPTREASAVQWGNPIHQTIFAEHGKRPFNVAQTTSKAQTFPIGT
jgi:hypothetical protein